MSCHNKSKGMTPLGEAVHERCKTGECSITTATVCTTTVAALVALLGPQCQAEIDGPHPEQISE